MQQPWQNTQQNNYFSEDSEDAAYQYGIQDGKLHFNRPSDENQHRGEIVVSFDKLEQLENQEAHDGSQRSLKEQLNDIRGYVRHSAFNSQKRSLASTSPQKFRVPEKFAYSGKVSRSPSKEMAPEPHRQVPRIQVFDRKSDPYVQYENTAGKASGLRTNLSPVRASHQYNRTSSPSKQIKVLFNQVSRENPFCPAQQESDNEEEKELSQSLPPSRFYDNQPPQNLTSLDQSVQSKVSRMSDLRNQLENNQVEMMNKKKKYFSGVQRFSDPKQPYESMKSQQQIEKTGNQVSSQYNGCDTEFQSMMMARGNTPPKMRKPDNFDKVGHPSKQGGTQNDALRNSIGYYNQVQNLENLDEYQRNKYKNTESQIEIDGFLSASKPNLPLNLSQSVIVSPSKKRSHNRQGQRSQSGQRGVGNISLNDSMIQNQSNHQPQPPKIPPIVWPTQIQSQASLTVQQQPTGTFPAPQNSTFNAFPPILDESVLSFTQDVQELQQSYTTYTPMQVNPIQQAIDLPQDVYKILQEPIYQRVSQDVLKDFNQSSIKDLQSRNKDKIGLFQKNPELQRPFKQALYKDDEFMNVSLDSVMPYDMNYCATVIQKHMRGYLARNNKDFKNLNRFFTLTRKTQIHLQFKNLVKAMRLTHQAIKKKRQFMLNGYITYCAVKIQKVWKGHQARSQTIPFRRALKGQRVKMFQAIIIGWRTRQIMNLKESKDRAGLVTDHDKQEVKDLFKPDELKLSRQKAAYRFVGFIQTLESDGNGQWIMFKKGIDRKGYKIDTSMNMTFVPQTPKTQFNDDIQIVKRQPRGNQSQIRQRQPTQTAQKSIQSARPAELSKASPENKTYVSIYANNLFQPNFQTDEYKSAAKESFKRRMQYDPRSARMQKSQTVVSRTMTSEATSILVGNQFQNQRNSSTMNGFKKANEQKQLRYSETRIPKISSNPYLDLGKETKIVGFRDKDPLEKRMSYIPDLKKRNTQKSKVETPETFLATYVERKKIRQSSPDKVDANHNMSVEAADLRSHYLGKAVRQSKTEDDGTNIAIQELQKYKDRKSIRDQITRTSDLLVERKVNQVRPVNIDLEVEEEQKQPVQRPQRKIEENKQTYSYSSISNKYVNIYKRERSPTETVSVERQVIPKAQPQIVRQTSPEKVEETTTKVYSYQDKVQQSKRKQDMLMEDLIEDSKQAEIDSATRKSKSRMSRQSRSSVTAVEQSTDSQITNPYVPPRTNYRYSSPQKEEVQDRSMRSNEVQQIKELDNLELITIEDQQQLKHSSTVPEVSVKDETRYSFNRYKKDHGQVQRTNTQTSSSHYIASSNYNMEVLKTVSEVSSSTNFLQQQIERLEKEKVMKEPKQSGRAVERLTMQHSFKDEPYIPNVSSQDQLVEDEQLYNKTEDFQGLQQLSSDPSSEKEEQKQNNLKVPNKQGPIIYDRTRQLSTISEGYSAKQYSGRQNPLQSTQENKKNITPPDQLSQLSELSQLTSKSGKKNETQKQALPIKIQDMGINDPNQAKSSRIRQSENRFEYRGRKDRERNKSTNERYNSNDEHISILDQGVEDIEPIREAEPEKKNKRDHSPFDYLQNTSQEDSLQFTHSIKTPISSNIRGSDIQRRFAKEDQIQQDQSMREISMFDQKADRSISQSSKLSQEIINEIRSDLSKSSQRRKAGKSPANSTGYNSFSKFLNPKKSPNNSSALDKINESAIPHAEQDLLEMVAESPISRANKEVSKIQYPTPQNTTSSSKFTNNYYKPAVRSYSNRISFDDKQQYANFAEEESQGIIPVVYAQDNERRTREKRSQEKNMVHNSQMIEDLQQFQHTEDQNVFGISNTSPEQSKFSASGHFGSDLRDMRKSGSSSFSNIKPKVNTNRKGRKSRQIDRFQTLNESVLTGRTYASKNEPNPTARFEAQDQIQPSHYDIFASQLTSTGKRPYKKVMTQRYSKNQKGKSVGNASKKQFVYEPHSQQDASPGTTSKALQVHTKQETFGVTTPFTTEQQHNKDIENDLLATTPKNNEYFNKYFKQRGKTEAQSASMKQYLMQFESKRQQRK